MLICTPNNEVCILHKDVRNEKKYIAKRDTEWCLKTHYVKTESHNIIRKTHDIM